ncbi:hypothetical protein HKCCSP123_02595 [Rhodobacterales bacterium HKCCSP123]|nr:hypothetical protein [Rhodobacterales bacterium HKCCSP123]
MSVFRAVRPLLAAVGLCLVTSAAAQADGYAYRHGAGPMVITVSCYRGPWDDVIWDRPNPEFVDSLVSVGYSFSEAHAIAERVCRDPAAVGRSGVLSTTMTNILRTSPPGS